MNRLSRLFTQTSSSVLSVYFTAGFPGPDDTVPLIRALDQAGADIVEIGIPYSDPIADGPTIQASNQQALDQGMTLEKLFAQLENIRAEVDVPLVLMGYINPVLQYGMERFCADCQRVGIDGLILPDLPLNEYARSYRALWQAHGLRAIFLITPQTPEARIRQVDELSEGFIYMVSSASVTGGQTGINAAQVAYFERVGALQLRNPRLIGFGIADAASFQQASQYAHGAIIGSAFIRALAEAQDPVAAAVDFVRGIRPPVVS